MVLRNRGVMKRDPPLPPLRPPTSCAWRSARPPPLCFLTCVRLCLSATEIGRVRKDMYNDSVNGGMFNRRDMEELPEAVGPVVQLQEKLYVPVKEYPDVSAPASRRSPPRGLPVCSCRLVAPSPLRQRRRRRRFLPLGVCHSELAAVMSSVRPANPSRPRLLSARR